IEPRASLALHVVDESKKPVPQVVVTLGNGQIMNRHKGVTDDEGLVSFTSLNPESFAISVRDTSGNELKAHRTTRLDEHRPEVMLSPGENLETTLEVESANGIVKGRVVDSGGEAVSDVVVRAVQGGSARDARWASMNADDAAAFTDETGSFVIAHL